MAIVLSKSELKRLGIKTGGENKYQAEKRELDGISFDSRKEAQRYCELMMLQRAGQISELKRQVPFELIPTQRDSSGRVLEKACKYVADFVYTENGRVVVEDVKGLKTKEYRIKKKLMLFIHGIGISEV